MAEATLAVDHGKYTAGQSFDVVKEAKTTTIVRTSAGKRIILPNSKLVGYSANESDGFIESQDSVSSNTDSPGRVAIVELNVPQMGVLKALQQDTVDMDRLMTEFIDASGLSEEDAKKDVVFINAHVDRGSTFIQQDGKAIAPPPGSTMSEKERIAVEAMLGNSTYDSTTLGVQEIEEEVEEEPTLGPDQIWFTDVSNGRLPASGINHIICQYAEDHFPEEHRVHIPKVKASHYWDVEVLEALVLAHSLREKALITGLPGTGKSSSVEQFAAWLRQPYMRLGGRGDLESSSFLGYSWADIEEVNGEMISKMSFKPGMLTQGAMYGYLTTIDEVMKIPPYIQMAMQHLYEKDGYLTIDDKPGTQEDKIVRPVPEFLMILTDNVKGTGDNFDKFAATQMQDTSSLDRISINETLNYLAVEDEVSMLYAMFPKVDKPIIKKLVKFAGLVRNGYTQGSIALTLSPRGLIAILEIIGKGIPMKRAIDLAYLNKIADDTEVVAVREMIRTVNL